MRPQEMSRESKDFEKNYFLQNLNTYSLSSKRDSVCKGFFKAHHNDSEMLRPFFICQHKVESGGPWSGQDNGQCTRQDKKQMGLEINRPSLFRDETLL